MFCPNCGRQLPDDSAFCEQCGTQIEPEQGANVVNESQTAPPKAPPANTGKTTEQLSQFVKKNKKVIGISAGVLVVIVAVMIFILTRPLTVKLGDYITVSFSGYDTMGHASYHFDSEAFYQDYAGKIAYQVINSGDLINDEVACEMLLQECVSGELSKSTELSNGEEITFQWTCDDDAAREDFDVRLSYEDLNFVVEGLEEAETADPFADVEIVYSGIGPNGEASVVNNSDASYAYDLDYVVEPSSGLSNGDTITISLPWAETEEGQEYYLSTYGVIFSETEKTYTVEGLGAYVSALSQINEETMEEMRSRGEDALRAEAAQDWLDGISLDSINYIGSYLLTAKDTNQNSSRNNMLYLIYQVQSSANFPEDGFQESFSYYYTVRFDDLIVMPDNTITVDFGEYEVPDDRSDKEFNNRRSYYNGYEDMDTLFRECVSVNVDRYKYETNIAENQPSGEEQSTENQSTEEQSNAEQESEE